MQGLGNRQNGQIVERLDNDHRHIGSAEACDFRGGFNIETVAIKGPEGNPENDTTLISGRERQCLRVLDVHIGRRRGNDPLGHHPEDVISFSTPAA